MSMSLPLFGTELQLSTFIIIVIELIILIVQLIHYLRNPEDNPNISFILLIIAFLNFNITDGLLPDKHFNLPFIYQNTLAYGSCIIVASYYFYYLVKELELKLNALFNPKVLFLTLVTTYCLSYLMNYFVTQNIQTSKVMFIGFSIIIGSYFCINTIIRLIRLDKQASNNTPFKFMIYSGYLGIIFMATMPISDAISDNQYYTVLLVNMSFFLSALTYYKRVVFQNNIKFMWLGYKLINPPKRSIEDISERLTNREIEVAYMIIQPNETYLSIAKKMYVSDKTISKHASNIFKKTGVKNRKEFLSNYVIDKVNIDPVSG